jgi:hypothetical protein
VDLKERFDYIKEQYAEYFKETDETTIYAIEKEIFDKIDIEPEDVK